MPYDSNITRATPGGSPLIPEVVRREIVAPDAEKSAAMQLMQTIDMGTNQTRIPVMASYPLAYFITGSALADRDVGLKQTTTMTWDNVYLNAEEMAVIVPIPNNLVADTKYPLWDLIRPRVREAIAIALDDAVFFGTNKPTTWPNAIVPGAVAASNQVVAGTSTIDVLDDINEVMRLVENDGYDVTGFWGRNQLRGKLRGLRSTTKELLFVPDNGTPSNVGIGGTTRGTLYNEPIVFSKAGFSSFATGAANYSMIAGQWDQAILGIRQDIQMESFDSGVITDDAGNIVFNLLQQDMRALRVIWRGGFAVPNPINRMNQTAGTRYPFAVLKQNVGGTGE
jgi:HK97 family phage major capsid protein